MIEKEVAPVNQQCCSMFDQNPEEIPTFCPSTLNWCKWKLQNDPSAHEKNECIHEYPESAEVLGSSAELSKLLSNSTVHHDKSKPVSPVVDHLGPMVVLPGQTPMDLPPASVLSTPLGPVMSKPAHVKMKVIAPVTAKPAQV